MPHVHTPRKHVQTLVDFCLANHPDIQDVAGLTEDEIRQAAHLIAAAPEMLEALKQAQVFLRKLKAEYCPDPIPPNSDSGLDWDTQIAIHDAIEKAAGQ